jgi:hypothetical protein
MTATSLFVSGFNAFGQLSSESTKDLCEPQKFAALQDIGDSENLELLFSGWSETTIYRPGRTSRGNGQIIRHGNTNITLNSPLPDLCSGFGDHNGLLGVLSRKECIAFAEESQVEVHTALEDSLSDDETPSISHLVVAGNGHVVAISKSAGSPDSILEFTSFDNFRQWFDDEANAYHEPPASHVVPGLVVQLDANVTGFVCLTEDGNIYTWGDARHSSLGRSVSETEARSPGLVESLAGIKIKKISTDGWITAALSEDGAAYLIGTATPGTQHSISCLRELDPLQAALVEIKEGDEELDILDVAVGDGHVLLLTQGGRIFAAGDNRNGQLGLGQKASSFVQDWSEVKVPGQGRCVAVYAGPKSSFFRLEMPLT